MSTTTTLPILHFNDVYRVVPQKYQPGSSETIDTTQFAWLVDSIRDQWPALEGGGEGFNSSLATGPPIDRFSYPLGEGSKAKKDGLVLFSGDVFSPSVESSVTRGSHMVPVLNELGIDVSVTGALHLILARSIRS
jgi:5'-nucleotidase